MSGFNIYLELPQYLAQWYAYTCREHHFMYDDICPDGPVDPMNPVEPIKDSYESKVLHQNLRKQPNAIPEPVPEKATLALAIPYYKDKDPRTYNYLGKHARSLVEDALHESFDIAMWEELHLFRVILKRQDHMIWAFMENHGIECNETNWLAIAKRYQRLRNNYKAEKARQKRKNAKKSQNS